MEISDAGGEEARIAALEKKARDMDALVKGLLNELLDLKSIFMKMSRQWGESRVPEITETPAPAVAVSSDGSTIIRPRNARQPDVPAAPAEPAMVRIMQSDGTMKMEPRCGSEKTIDTTGGYRQNRKRS
jgi:hypothetical protein